MTDPVPDPVNNQSAWARFQASRVQSLEQWRDGIGYDLAAFAELSPDEQQSVLQQHTPPRDWRDEELLRTAGRPEATDSERIAALIHALATAQLMGGLSAALDEIETFHPPPIVDALFHALEVREGPVAYHCAALLAVAHGVIDSPLDFTHRELFLRFNTDDRAERDAALTDLRALLATRASPSA